MARSGASDLEKFLESMDSQWQKLAPLIGFYNQNPSIGGMGAYREILMALRRGATKAELLELCTNGIKSRGEILAMRNITQFLTTGEPLLPLDIRELGNWLVAESERERLARVESHKQLRAYERQLDEQKAEEKRKAAREKLAQETGIPADQLEKMAAKPTAQE